MQDEAEGFGDKLVLVTGTTLHEDGGVVGLMKGTLTSAYQPPEDCSIRENRYPILHPPVTYMYTFTHILTRRESAMDDMFPSHF